MRRASSHVVIEKLSTAERVELLDKYVLPHCRNNGVSLQTCTAVDVVNAATDTHPFPVTLGACVGTADVVAVCGSESCRELRSAKKKRGKVSEASSQRWCTCHPHRDVGSQHEPCVHGCRYCFMNPKEYSW